LPFSSAARLDRISLRPAAQIEPFFGPFGPPGSPREALSRPATSNCAKKNWGCPGGARRTAGAPAGKPA
jgi:hypothetical protein